MWGARLRQRGDALALAVAMEGDGEARGGERGLYTLLVEDGAGRPVMYRQVSAEGVFTVPAPRSGDSYAIHFLNNRWIGDRLRTRGAGRAGDGGEAQEKAEAAEGAA